MKDEESFEKMSFIQENTTFLDFRNRLVCFNKFMFCEPKHSFGPFFTLIYLTVNVFYFYIVIGPFYWDKCIPIYFIGLILSILTYIFILDCVFSDPGYQRINVSTDRSDNNEITEDENEGKEGEISYKDEALKRFEDFNKRRYCSTCKIYRLPKATHCKFCNRCAKEFDHHCFVVGNCIGERNIKSFLLMSNIGTLISILGIALAIYQSYSLIAGNEELIEKFSKNIFIQPISFYVVLGFGLFFTICGGNAFCSSLGIIILGVSFIYYTSQLLGGNTSYNENPSYGIFFIVMVIPMISVLLENAIETLKNAYYGVTYKENLLIKRVASREINDRAFQITFSQGIQNLKEFFQRKRSKSEFLNNIIN